MPVQDHIHLSRVLNDNPEYAPDLKWSAIEWSKPLEYTAMITRGLTGRLNTFLLENAAGPIIFTNFRLKIKVEATDTETLDQRIALLKEMNGQLVSFVDFNHANDDADHTSDIKPMLCRIGELPSLETPDLSFFYVDVELMDASL